MILAVILFHICFFVMMALFSILGINPDGVIYAVIFGIPAFISVYPKMKKEKKLLRMGEKIMYILFTWGVIVALAIGNIIVQSDAEPTLPGILTVSFNFFMMFCGVWLVISTFSQKLFLTNGKNA